VYNQTYDDVNTLQGLPFDQWVQRIKQFVDSEGEDKTGKDVSIYPGITKKGRPTNLVCVICDDAKVDSIIDTLVLETGTLGIRISNSNRFIVPRTKHNFSLTFDGKSFEVNYKKSSHNAKTHFKIEFDDLKNISNALDKPIVDIESFLRKEIEKIEGL